MKPKIVFSDVDGTFADKDHQPIAADAPVVQALVAMGVPVCLVSARPPQGLRSFQRSLGFEGPIVCYSGAYVLDEMGRTLASEIIPIDEAREIYAYLTESLPNICVNTYGFDEWVVANPDDPRVKHEEKLIHACARASTDIEGIFSATGVHKFLLMGDPDNICAAEQSVGEHYPDLNVVRSSETLCEIMSKRASKSAGVARLCEHFDLLSDDAVAFGDSYNDLDMIGAVGRSFAMANAVPAVKAAATDVIEWTNDESGVARTLAKLFEL